MGACGVEAPESRIALFALIIKGITAFVRLACVIDFDQPCAP
jgi:hypothetical protein